jgi:subtilisin family serine protease
MLRKPKLFTGRLAAVFLGTFVLPLAAQQPPPAREFVPGQLIVGFKSPQALDRAVDELKQAEQSGGLAARGARSSSVGIERLSDKSAKVNFDFRSRSGTKLAEGAELEALEDYAKALTQQNPNVEYAHPNWVLQLQRDRIQDPVFLEDMPPDTRVQISRSMPSEPNDPVFRSGLLWHYLPPPAGMNAIGAWPTAKGDKAIVVAVIDTGMLPDHPDIKGSGNVLTGYDFISDPDRRGEGAPRGRNADPTDRGDACPPRLPTSSWHGTHVSGTVGAAGTNNNVGIAGVNWSVSVLPVRALGRCGGTIEDLAAAVRWSAGLDVPDVPKNERKADIINLSLGIRLECKPQFVGALLDAIAAARNAGTTIVVAAGNESVDIAGVTPSGCPGVISVAAADQRGHLTPYSNFGHVTIMAPGGDLRRDDDQDNRPDGVWSLVAPSTEHPAGVAAYEGTSMAAPHVTAAIALALTAKPELRGKPDEIEALLTRSLAPLPDGACSKACGRGLLDAKRMVEPEMSTSSTSSKPK